MRNKLYCIVLYCIACVLIPPAVRSQETFPRFVLTDEHLIHNICVEQIRGSVHVVAKLCNKSNIEITISPRLELK